MTEDERLRIWGENMCLPILWRHYDPYNCAMVSVEDMGRPYEEIKDKVRRRGVVRGTEAPR